MSSRTPAGMQDDRVAFADLLSPSADYVIAGSDASDDMKMIADLVLTGVDDADKIDQMIDQLASVGGKIILIGSSTFEKAVAVASPTLMIQGWGRSTKITVGGAWNAFTFTGTGHVTFQNIEIDGNAVGLYGISAVAGVPITIRDCKIHSHATNDVLINITGYNDVYNLDSAGTYSRFEYAGSIVGDVTGDLIGDVLATDSTKVLENGTDGTNSTYLGTVTGSASKLPSGTPVNAVYAIGVLTVGGDVIDAETVTIDSRVYEFDGDGVTTGDVAVDISASMTASTETLTIGGVVIDTETVTLGGTDIYEFDTDDTPHVGANIRVDISETSGFSTRSEGTITFVNGDIHNDTVVINLITHTLKADGTADSATVCDITGAASIVAGSGVFGLGGPVADTETITINARVYEFDSGGGIGGDVAIDVSGGLGIDNALTELVTAINGDGAAVVTAAAYTPGDNEVTLTSKIAGLVGNYVVSEAVANGGWQLGQGAAGTLTDGADATALELGVIFDAHLNAAGAQADIISAIGISDDKVTLTWAKGGVAGDLVTLTETLTAGGVDGAGFLGGTTAGVDCVQADAALQLIASITANDAVGVGAATGGAGIVDMTADIPGVIGDTIAVAEAMANGAFVGAFLAGGADCSAANAITALVAAINGDGSSVVTAFDGVGDTMYVYADVKGTVGNALNSLEAMANGAWGAGTLAGGIDGTVGAIDDILTDVDFIYLAEAANTVADDNWEYIPKSRGGNKRREVEVAATYYTKPTDDLISCTAGSITIVCMTHAFKDDEIKTIWDKDGAAGGANITVVDEAGNTLATMATNYQSVDIIKPDDDTFRII